MTLMFLWVLSHSQIAYIKLCKNRVVSEPRRSIDVPHFYLRRFGSHAPRPTFFPTLVVPSNSLPLHLDRRAVRKGPAVHLGNATLVLSQQKNHAAARRRAAALSAQHHPLSTGRGRHHSRSARPERAPQPQRHWRIFCCQARETPAVRP